MIIAIALNFFFFIVIYYFQSLEFFIIVYCLKEFITGFAYIHLLS